MPATSILPMYWITGNYYDCRQKWQEICALVGDPNVEVFDCEYNTQNGGKKSAQAGDIILRLKQKDMFDTRSRIIKLKGIPDDYAILTDYLRLANKKNMIVIDGPVGYRKPPSKRLIPVKATKFFKEFVKRGELCEFPELAKTDALAIRWVVGVAKNLGKNLDPEAAKLLVELQGRNLDGLYAEVSKLSDYQEGKKITVDDVKTCTAPLFLRTVWDLLEDLAFMNVDASLSHLQKFYEYAGLETGTSFRGDVEMLLGAMLKQFNFYIAIKDACGDSLDYDKLRNKTAGLKKRSSKMVDGETVDNWDTDYFDSRFINVNLNKESTQSVSKWPWHRAYNIVRQIHMTRLALRTHSHISEYNRGGIKLLLDSLALMICGKLTPRQLNAMKGELA